MTLTNVQNTPVHNHKNSHVYEPEQGAHPNVNPHYYTAQISRYCFLTRFTIYTFTATFTRKNDFGNRSLIIHSAAKEGAFLPRRKVLFIFTKKASKSSLESWEESALR